MDAHWCFTVFTYNSLLENATLFPGDATFKEKNREAQKEIAPIFQKHGVILIHVAKMF